MSIVRLRFPNVSEYDEMPTTSFDWNAFRLDATYSDEVFGYYKGSYIVIIKEDYVNRSTT